MNEVYEFDGQTFHVPPEKLEKFKLEYPDAVKTGMVQTNQPEPQETIMSSSSYSKPSDVLGVDIEGENSSKNFFNKNEEVGVKQLSELYPEFDFKQKALGEQGGLDAITVSTKDGKYSASFDMNIGGMNTYGGAAISELQGRNKSFDILTDFVNLHSTQKNQDAQTIAKNKRKELLTQTNLKRDKLAAPEIEEIETKFTDGSLFKIIQSTTTTSTDALTSGLLQTTATEQPYKKELEQAFKELKQELNGEKPSQDKVQQRAKEIIINSIQEEKLTEIIDSEDYQLNLTYDDFGMVKSIDESTISKAQKYEIAAKEFDIDFVKDLNIFQLKNQELANGKDVVRLNKINSIIEDPNLKFEIVDGENVLQLKNGKLIPEKVLNEYIDLNHLVNNKANALNKFAAVIQEKAVQYEDNVAAIDIARRNYNGVEEFVVETSLGLGELLINTSAGINMFFGGENKNLIKSVTDIKKKTQEIRDSYSKDVEFDDAFSSLSNFASFAMQEVSNQIPIFAALAIPGGQAAIGFGAFGEQYINLSNERDSDGGRQKSNANIWWSSVGFGASELVFESLTTLPLLRAAKRGFNSTPGNKTLFDMTAGKYFKKNIGNTVYGTLSEPIGEGMTQWTQNLIDGKPLTQGLDHAMFSGLMFGTTLSATPFARGLYLSKFNDHNKMKLVRGRVEKMKIIHQNNKNLQTKIDILLRRGSGNKDVSSINQAKTDIETNNNIIKDLQSENVAEMQEIETNLKGTSNDALKEYFDLEQYQEGIKLEAQSTVDNKSLTDKQIKERLEFLQQKFDAAQYSKDQFRDKDAFGDEYTAFSGMDKNKDRVAEIQKQARNILNGRGKKDPTEIELFNEAKIIYNTDKINANHAANQRKGLNDVINAQTKEDAIEKINNLTNVDENVKKQAIKGIQNGNHGANIPTIDGKNIPMQVVESMAADDRLESRTHEVGHSVFIKAISADPKAFDSLAESILQDLKTNNPSAYKRLTFRLGDQTASDEVVMLFLEEVAAGKVDFKKNGKAGFFATLMMKGVEDVGGKMVDLRGETDAINFLVGIAKKIKDGTIKNTDIADIRANVIAKDARKSVNKKPSKQEVKSSKTQRSMAVEAVNEIEKGLRARLKKDKKEYTKEEFQKSKEFNDLFESISLENGAINNYIKALPDSPEKKKKLMRLASQRLMNYNPKAERKTDSKKEITIGEAIMSNIGYAKLDAATEFVKEKQSPTRPTEKADENIADDSAESTTGTSNVKTKLKQTRARQLTSLADLDVESSPLIKETTKVELKKLIESNPKNLIEQIQNVLIQDLVEITRQEMGVIGQVKGELNIPETYNAYLSNTYQKTISSMEILKIRTNYKNLFRKEKMGFADYKTEKSNKPNLKKDSNYRKDIFRNVTTKAEFIKYHTEGKKNKLIANQRNLALMRAEAEVVQAADNYIIENSKDLNQVYAAELRSFIDSKTTQKQKEENKSFDSVKFSKTIGIASFELRDAVLTGKNVFDNNGNLLAPYKNITGNKKDSKAVGDFIWANIDLLTPDSDFKFLRKAYEQLYKSGQRGTAYETNLIESAIAVEKIFGTSAIEVVLRKPTESDALPDMILSVHGVKMNIEAKMANAQYSSVTNAIVDGEMVVKKKYSDELVSILTELQKESQKGIKKAKKFLKENGIEWDGLKVISEEGHNMLKNNVDPDTQKSYFNGMSATLPLPLKFIAEIYNNKKHPVYLMQMMGRGLFSMGGDTFGLGIPGLETYGDGFIRLRVGSNSKYETVTTQEGVKMKVKTGMKSYSYRSIPGISDNVLNTMKSTQNIESVAGVMKLVKSKGVKSLEKQQQVKNSKRVNNAINVGRLVQKETKGITVLDFDDTLATSKSLIKYTQPDGTKGTLTPEQYASTYQDLQDLGYEFDFSEFNKVVDGKIAPLFQKALKLQSKFGPENMFVLTARPAESAPAIFAFIKANGLNIPLKNITGLANSTSEAKALWIADKVGEGYNDFYFADDALQNVQAVDNMLNQFDVKRKVQQAKVKFSESMNKDFNDILESVTGIESQKRFNFIKARKRGAGKGKFRIFIPPSHEDFVGLLYNFMGRGKEGNAHRDFLEESLIRPLNRANKEHDTARQSVATDYKNLNKEMPEVKKMLTKKTPDGDFVYQDAIRVYLWDKHGHKIPGLSETDQAKLVELVNSDPSLKNYAETLNIVSKQEKYVDPTDGWDSGDIRMDLDDATGRIGRAEFFAEFSENADVIFSTENLNKIEAGYGKGVREALEDMLYRIKTGRNKPTGQSGMVNTLMNWLNGSVGSVMFFNMRSALLQQMSIVNYINFADNNVFAAAKAFANQPQYWRDWAFIFNSDMLKQRRGGIMTDVNGAELAADMRKSKSPHRFLISKLLELGFLPTQIGDNIAIATGGASYYRNRINKYIKEGLSKTEAEAKAFTDFQDITQSTQQSARPDMVSQQQASVIGKVILNFQNVTSQFNRLGKKAFQDIYNRRITKPNSTQLQSDISNASRITYYFAVQNAIFYTLQTALFAMMFDDDEEDNNNLFLKKRERLINGSIDSVLRGTGLYGSVVATLKNVAIAFARQRDVNYNPDESAVVVEALNLSPVLGIKARKIVNAEKTLNYNKKVMDHMETFDIDNPQWSAVTNYVEGFTNLPLNRLYNKTQNIRQGLNNDHSNWERTLLFLGWSQYNLNLANEKMDAIKEETKKKKKKKVYSKDGTRTKVKRTKLKR